MEHYKIYGDGKFNEEDRLALSTLLIKAGYTVKIGREMEQGKRSYTYFVEYWRE